MASEITMPQLSDTMTEGTVVKWHRKEGDQVQAGEEIADVETDKATMPMEAFDSGTLAYVAVGEGTKVKVGQLIAVIATPGENPVEVKAKAQAGKKAGAEAKGEGEQRREEEKGRETAPAPAGPAPTDTEARGRAEAVPGEGEAGGRLKISPLARRLAAEKKVPLEDVHGTGPGGRIIERDILAYVEEAGAAAAPPAPAAPARAEERAAGAPAPRAMPPAPAATAPAIGAGQKKVVSMTKMRSAIAAALQRSKQNLPHFYESIDIDVEELVALRQRLNEKLEKENVRLSVVDFVTRAVATALLIHPQLNARFDAQAGQITQYGDVNMGIAVAIPDGLIVPVLRGANRLGLREIRIRTADLVERARAQRLRREEQTEATFTVSSLGGQGIRQFSAIINPPEVGILAVGSAEKRAVVRGGQIVPRTTMTVTLSVDHRAVDGATAAEFLNTLKGLLEEPGMLLL